MSYNGQITKMGLVKPAVSVTQNHGKILWEERLNILELFLYCLTHCQFFLRYFAFNG